MSKIMEKMINYLLSTSNTMNFVLCILLRASYTCDIAGHFAMYNVCDGKLETQIYVPTSGNPFVTIVFPNLIFLLVYL